jgi:hypothetical protein
MRAPARCRPPTFLPDLKRGGSLSASRRADEYGPRELPIPKHVRVYLEAVRSAAAVLAVVLNSLVLARVFGLL